MTKSVGRPIPHDSAAGHVTGATRFLADLPPLAGELCVTLVGSPCAAGELLDIDLGRAREVPGVVGVYTHADLRGGNRFGAIVEDEVFLVEDRIGYIDQPVAVIAAVGEAAAEEARSLVEVRVAEHPPVLTIDEAIRTQSFLGAERRIARGDFAEAWSGAERRFEGQLSIGGQEHFYLESQAALAIPSEGGRLTLQASTQNPSELQAVVARVLGLGMHEVVCLCERMGGAFGGKETQAAIPALAAALVAHQTGRPARIVYGRRDDMLRTGKRHPYHVEWQAACDGAGRIVAARLEFHANGGDAADLSQAVLERTVLHADNAYYVPNLEISGRICRTNLPPNTAFRGFGAPQAVAAMEGLVQDVAARLGRDAYEIRRANCYGHGERAITPYGQEVRNNLLPEIFERLHETSGYSRRLAEIEAFNREPDGASEVEIRGLAMTAVKFGISFVTKFLNQANALVNVYHDGTVQVSTGATEMGQGVNTKIRQIVADQFGLPLDRVRVMPTSTEKNNNTSPTAASASTDLNGAAAIDACDRIKGRMAIVAARMRALDGDRPEEICFEDGHVFVRGEPGRRIDFGEVADRARRERVDLGARGFFATPDLDFDPESGRGTPFRYYTTGCAVAEVTIDRWTGEVRTRRADLLMDIGRPINPGIDRGQVIGGFVQGLGWVTTEELVYDDRGELLSAGPSTYKIPDCTDIPADFRVAFMDNDRNEQNIHRSKGMGEPPLLLAVSVWAAVKHALSCAVPGEPADLDLPATSEGILTALSRR